MGVAVSLVSGLRRSQGALLPVPSLDSVLGVRRFFDQAPVTNRGDDEEYRWWEASYFVPLGIKQRPRHEPFSASDYEQADLAAAPAVAACHQAEGPWPIDHEDFPAFANRWVNRLALASEGNLQQPRSLPI